MNTKNATTSKRTKASTGASAQDRAELLDALHAQITDGVAALVESGGWQAMLTAAARFHQYSLSNLLLIGAQAPHATRVAGFRTWQSLGRQVRKGERGIAILAPCTYCSKPDSSTEQPADTAPSTEAPASPGARQVRGFRPVYVFDLAQTDGDPLPEARRPC